jgi:hypothetical protein
MYNLDANVAEKECAKLASYDWFNIPNIDKYESDELTQATWKEQVKKDIGSNWSRRASLDDPNLENYVRKSIDFQKKLNFSPIVIPAPLTADYNTDYSLELKYLDFGKKYIDLHDNPPPVYFTVAINDSCLRNYEVPEQNKLINMILDNVSARQIDGVYLVFEVAAEHQFSRYIENENVLKSALYFVHEIANVANKKIIVNYFGPFGVFLSSIGATVWASNWYKSLVRMRLSDHTGEGRVWPLFWSFNAMIDIHMEKEFQNLVDAGIYDKVKDITPASRNIDRAVQRGEKIESVPLWRYSMGNKKNSIEQYLYSMVKMEKTISSISSLKRKAMFLKDRVDNAYKTAKRVNQILGKEKKTRTKHMTAWKNAFEYYINTHDF